MRFAVVIIVIIHLHLLILIPPHTDGSIPMKAPTNFPDFFFLLFYATMATMNLLPPST